MSFSGEDEPMERPTRKIVHVDMDAFYASVEQRDDPALRGRPVVVAWKGPRSVVCAASYEARTFGVRSAMPALRAARLCPDAVFVPPDFTRYKAVSAELRAIFARHTDLIEPLSLDEAYLDVTHDKAGLPSATATATAIRAAVRKELRLTASAGVAPNKFLAKIASDQKKPDGLFVVRPRDVDAFLRDLPVGRLPGVGRVTAEKLTALGVTAVRDLRALGRAALVGHFGRFGVRLDELSRGIDDSPVVSERASHQVSAEDTFETDLLLPQLSPHIAQMAARAWRGYERELEEGRRARTVVLKLKTADFKTLTRSLTPAAPPRSLEELVALVELLKARVGLPEGTRYRLVGVGLAGLTEEPPRGVQLALFDWGR